MFSLQEFVNETMKTKQGDERTNISTENDNKKQKTKMLPNTSQTFQTLFSNYPMIPPQPLLSHHNSK